MTLPEGGYGIDRPEPLPSRTELEQAEARTGHSERFRRVANSYPRRVAQAYGFDLDQAAADSDVEVAAMVATYEASLGLEPADWWAIGTSEGR